MKPIHVWQLGFFVLAWYHTGFLQAVGFFCILLVLEVFIQCTNT